MTITLEKGGLRFLAPVIAVATALLALSGPAFCAPKAKSILLDNGMQVVVIEDHRAPVVTHIIAYRVGAADDPQGASGAAHYLEHMMFKTAGLLKAGEYAAHVSRNGGSTNAVTTHDATIYHARVPRETLPWLMEKEAQRMRHLDLLLEEFEAERGVIQAERRFRVDADPINVLREEAAQLLYIMDPHRRPAIGWAHEIAALERRHLAALYERFYAPANATVVVVGDVTAAEVFELARKSYGNLSKPQTAIETRKFEEPPARGARRVVVMDPRVDAPTLYRVYSVPGHATATRRDALSLDVLATILTQRHFGRLGRGAPTDLVSSDGGYAGNKRGKGQFAVLLTGAPGADTARLERHLDTVIAQLREADVTPDELETAVNILSARRSFELDDQLDLARLYAETLASGGSVEELEQFDQALRNVTVADVRRVCETYLLIERSVTGILLPAHSTHIGMDGGVTMENKP